MALEDDAVETGEHGDNQAGKLGNEARQRLHGVLLWNGAGATRILKEKRRFFLSLFGCGYAALGAAKKQRDQSSVGSDGVIPLAVELRWRQSHASELSIAHLDPGLILVGVQGGLYHQPRLG